MGVYRAVILVAAALVSVVDITQAGVCKGRSTVLQVKVPNRTNVTIQYPNQNNQVVFVPYPYQQPDSSHPPECYTCRGSKCQRCEKIDYNSRPSRPPTYTKTNIIIDLTKDKSDKNPQKGKDDSIKKGTVIVLQDDNAATSTSGSSAKGKGVSASSSASTSITNTDIIASLNENGSINKSGPRNTEDIYVLDASKSASASLSTASADGKPQKDQPDPPKNPPPSPPSKEPSAPKQPSPSQQPPAPNSGSPSNSQPAMPTDNGSPSDDHPSSPDPSNPPPSDDDKSQPSQPDQTKSDPKESTPPESKDKVDKLKAEVEAKIEKDSS